MFDPLLLIAVIVLYMGLLLLAARWTEKGSALAVRLVEHPATYTLCLAVYCTTWTFYGSVGKAVSSGMLFLTIYLGPTLGILVWWTVLRRLVRIKSAHHITSIADFLSARYGKSGVVAALATLMAVVGIIPYISLQLKALIATFSILTSRPGWSENAMTGMTGLLMVVMMTLFTIAFGVRRLDPTERHPGMLMAVAVQSLVKLAAFLALGLMVAFGYNQGLGGLLDRLGEEPYRQLMALAGPEEASHLTWASYLLLGMSAILFLPRQFHMAVVENCRERHILSARWMFPLYLLAINFFVVPIAVEGLKLGLAPDAADTFVLRIPLAHGHPWLAVLVFIGGLSAGTSMIMICSMTLSTMFTNHFLLPLAGVLRPLAFLNRRVLACRWLAVALIIGAAYAFHLVLAGRLILVNIGMISFAAVLQFAPAILGGLFWRTGNRAGAILGLSGGFLVWLYTMFFPVFLDAGWFQDVELASVLAASPLLDPERLFGIAGMDPVSQAVFWSMVANVGLYVLGSLGFVQSGEERRIAEEFVGILEPGSPRTPRSRETGIPLDRKQAAILDLLIRYFPPAQARDILDTSLSGAGLLDRKTISIIELAGLYSEVERRLAGAIGSSAAHIALSRGGVFSEQESLLLSEAYGEILVGLKLSPEQMREKIDYYMDRERLLSLHAGELESKIRERDREIEERTRMEAALRQAEEKFRAIVENAPVGIYQSTPEGRYLNVNERFASILGYGSCDELLAGVKDIARQVWVRPELRGEMSRILEEQGEVRNFEAENRRRDGGVIWTSRDLRAVRGEDGGILFYDGFITDISERKRAEESLRKAHDLLEARVAERTRDLVEANAELAVAKQAADEATRAKSEFLANMSHEIRTPLNGVIAATDLALAEPLSPKAERYLRIVSTSAHSLLGVINDILDFSKIEAGRLELELRPFDPDVLFDDLADLFASRAAEKGVEFLLDVPAHPPWLLVGDPLRIRQVLVNLAGNAVKFTNKGHVAVGMRSEQTAPDRVVVTFSVRDSGVGISPEHLRLLFQPFSQADASTTRKYGGTGLGLSIAKRLTELMDGEIRAESEPGRGSVFTFRIPFQAFPAPEKELPASPLDIAGLRVLLVDDCAVSRDILRNTLGSFRFEVVEAASGAEALERMGPGGAVDGQDRRPFDLAVLDWAMPDMDGIQTAARMRQDLGFTGPILMLTAFGRDAERRAAGQAGVNAFLSKPATGSELFNVIVELLGRGRGRIPDQPQALSSLADLYRRRLRGLRVLVAEDNPVNQEIAVAVLETAGILCDVAGDGAEAVQAVARLSYDAVLMDIQMPGMDGYEATRRIRGEPRTARLPIIAMTAHAMKGDAEKCLEAGMDAYVSKPINQERLFEALVRHALPGVLDRTAAALAPPPGQGTPPPAPGMEAQDLPAELPGLRLQEAMDRAGLAPERYLSVLRRFHGSNRDAADRLRGLLVSGDRVGLVSLTHGLKGSAGSIGAGEVFDVALALERAAREGVATPDLVPLLDRLEIRLSVLFESLSRLESMDQGPAPESTGAAFCPLDMAGHMGRMARALEAAEPVEALTLLRILKGCLDDAPLDTLEDQIGEYEFDAARQTLAGLARRFSRASD